MISFRCSRWFLLPLFLCLVAAFGVQSIDASGEQPRYVGLTILHTNDVHGHLFPTAYDTYGPATDDIGGAARRATLIRSVKMSAKYPVLVMDAGDVFTRGPIADLLGAPDIAVMNMIPYDVMALGNNEFKAAPGIKGQEIMFERIKQARFPILSANVFRQSTTERIAPPYTVFSVDGVRVGVLGLTAPRVADYDQAKGLEISDPIAAARQVVPELRKEVDFVIALTHIGYPLDLLLAATVPGIDVIIGGDSHTWLDRPTFVPSFFHSGSGLSLNGTVINHAGEYGVRVAELNLRLRRNEDGAFKVMSYTSRLIDVDSSFEPAPDVETLLDHYSQQFLKPVGTLQRTVPRKEALGWVAECMRLAAGAEVGAVWNTNVENGLKAGRVTLLDIRKMLPFPNQLVQYRATGKQLKELVAENDCGLSGARITDDKLFVGDQIPDDEREYTLVIDDYFATQTTKLTGAPSTRSSLTVRDAVQKRLAPAGTPVTKGIIINEPCLVLAN